MASFVDKLPSVLTALATSFICLGIKALVAFITLSIVSTDIPSPLTPIFTRASYAAGEVFFSEGLLPLSAFVTPPIRGVRLIRLPMFLAISAPYSSAFAGSAIALSAGNTTLAIGSYGLIDAASKENIPPVLGSLNSNDVVGS